MPGYSLYAADPLIEDVGEVTVEFNRTQLSPSNDRVIATVMVNSTSQLTGMEFWINYRSDILSIDVEQDVTFEPSLLQLPGVIKKNDIENGKVTIALAGNPSHPFPNNTSGPLTIARLTFRVHTFENANDIVNLTIGKGLEEYGTQGTQIWLNPINTQEVNVTRTSGGNEPTDPPPVGNPSPPPPTPPTKVEQQVPPTGGTVTIPSKAAVDVPGGALTGNETISIAELDQDDANEIIPTNLTSKSPVFEFTTTAENSQFKERITLTLNIKPESTDDTSTFAVYYYHEERKKWIYLGGAVSSNNQTISVQVDHFTKFAVFANQMKTSFKDLPADHWAFLDIDRLVGLGIVRGYEDLTFRSNSPITRAELSTLLANALELDLTVEGTVDFVDYKDIPSWALPAVNATTAAGIVSGSLRPDGSVAFEANRIISREEIAVMIYKALKGESSSASLSFKDHDQISDWAYEAIKYTEQKKIISGYEDDTFRPKSNATRAEAASMMIQLLRQLGL